MNANTFQFMQPFENVSPNGLYLNNIYLPEEIIVHILSYIPPKKLLKLTLVCKKWCNIIKSHNLWMNIYKRHYFTKPKNGNGQQELEHWTVISYGMDKFKIENPPQGSDPLPPKIPDFKGYTSCFATSYDSSKKAQRISLTCKKLLRYIIKKFKPHIYVSEWVSGRFNCECIYKLEFKGFGEIFPNSLYYNQFLSTCSFSQMVSKTVNQSEGRNWEKVELLIEEYPSDINVFIFEHEGHGTQWWAGRFGSKMAGGVVRFVFDSIHPIHDPNTF